MRLQLQLFPDNKTNIICSIGLYYKDTFHHYKHLGDSLGVIKVNALYLQIRSLEHEQATSTEKKHHKLHDFWYFMSLFSWIDFLLALQQFSPVKYDLINT